MVVRMITIKLDETFLVDVDKVVRRERYHSRTEFIRTALREQLDRAKMKKAMLEIAHLKGKSKKKISNKQYERTRKRAFEELFKKK